MAIMLSYKIAPILINKINRRESSTRLNEMALLRTTRNYVYPNILYHYKKNNEYARSGSNVFSKPLFIIFSNTTMTSALKPTISSASLL